MTEFQKSSPNSEHPGNPGVIQELLCHLGSSKV